MVDYVIDKHLVSMVQSSEWLTIGSTDFMNIKRSLPLHTAIERIWLNVALSYNISWQEVMRTRRNTRILSARIITLLLTNSILKSYYEMKDHEINHLLGVDNFKLLDDYFEYIKGKKS
jgi:hypothetical protein